MKIIQIEPYESGARPALQDWDGVKLPDGYAWCEETFADVFYSTDPAGFVDITVEDDTVTAMTVNQAAYDAYIAANPDEPAEPEDAEPTADEILDALLGVNANE